MTASVSTEGETTTFSAREREILGRLADTLIPARGEWPGASGAGVAGPQLDRVLRVRPDLAEKLRALIAVPEARNDPERCLRQLHAVDRERFEELAWVVTVAYTMDATVRRLLGYRGQEPQVIAKNDAFDIFEALEQAPYLLGEEDPGDDPR